jgi:hypothetical protein
MRPRLDVVEKAVQMLRCFRIAKSGDRGVAIFFSFEPKAIVVGRHKVETKAFP